ncbi:MAG: FAD-dependent oxidoreductase [Pseudomonadota bacterium]
MLDVVSDANGAPGRRRIAVVGAGVSGLSAAWLLNKRHDVALYEADGRLGGHANTVSVRAASGREIPVDAGFIVFNKPNYPNFTALAGHIGLAIDETCMSFGASMDDGGCEYSGQSIPSLFARPASVFDPGHWAMLRDLLRFNARANAALLDGLPEGQTIGEFVRKNNLSEAFVERFLTPFAAAIWSARADSVLDYAASAFLRFFDNHGLLQVLNMPIWNTVAGGSKNYVEKLAADLCNSPRVKAPIQAVRRTDAGVEAIEASGERDVFDDVVIATHSDQALAMIEAPSEAERELLGAMRYQPNRAIVHTDPALMPRRRRAWSSWNYLGGRDGVAVSYWMNRLQNLGDDAPDVFVTLNPSRPIRDDAIVASFDYAHPMFDVAAERAQRRLWELQGANRLWFAGAYFGQGFHEDGLQAGLAVAEALGGVRRPWATGEWDEALESARIYRGPDPALRPAVRSGARIGAATASL